MFQNISEGKKGFKSYVVYLKEWSFHTKQKFQPLCNSGSRMFLKAKMDLKKSAISPAWRSFHTKAKKTKKLRNIASLMYFSYKAEISSFILSHVEECLKR